VSADDTDRGEIRVFDLPSKHFLSSSTEKLPYALLKASSGFTVSWLAALMPVIRSVVSRDFSDRQAERESADNVSAVVMIADKILLFILSSFRSKQIVYCIRI
jgi:hypothetical protein